MISVRKRLHCSALAIGGLDGNLVVLLLDLKLACFSKMGSEYYETTSLKCGRKLSLNSLAVVVRQLGYD